MAEICSYHLIVSLSLSLSLSQDYDRFVELLFRLYRAIYIWLLS